MGAETKVAYLLEVLCRAKNDLSNLHTVYQLPYHT